jgi:predicted NAD/FAD-dependent oxidoreductase
VSASCSVKMGTGARVVEDCWVSRMRLEKGQWVLWKNDERLGAYDVVVIAHNGKCATRLLSPAGAPLLAQQMSRMKLSSIWALMVAWDSPLPVDFEGAFVDSSPILSWAGNSSRLLAGGGADTSVWTLFSTSHYGKANKAPQEAVPAAVSQHVTEDLLQELARTLQLPLPPPVFTR